VRFASLTQLPPSNQRDAPGPARPKNLCLASEGKRGADREGLRE